MSKTELEFLTNPDGHDHIALGAVRLDASGNEVEGLAENEAMRALAVGLGSDARWLDGGVLEYDYRLPEPDLRDQSPWLSELFTLYEAHLESVFRTLGQAMGPVIAFYDWPESSRPNHRESAA